MAAIGRGSRVTVVDPWVAGGEGRVRDLFPLPPLLFLLFRGISSCIRHYQITLLVILSIYLWIAKDFAWYLAFIVTPIIIVSTKLLLITLWLWFKNPTIPLFARKP